MRYILGTKYNVHAVFAFWYDNIHTSCDALEHSFTSNCASYSYCRTTEQLLITEKCAVPDSCHGRYIGAWQTDNTGVKTHLLPWQQHMKYIIIAHGLGLTTAVTPKVVDFEVCMIWLG